MHTSRKFWGAALALVLGAGTASAGLMPLDDPIEDSEVLTFESLAAPVIPISGTAPVFTDFGISQVSAVASNGSDEQNQTGQSGNALFANASDLFVLPQGDTNPNLFGTTTSFTIELAEMHSNFGVSFQDQVGSTFNLEFFNGLTSLGTISKAIPTTQDTPFRVNSTDAFNRVVISGGDGGDGWGIDNIELVPSVREITLADFDGSFTTIDFESELPFTVLDGTTAPLFADVGLQVSATGGTGSLDISSVNNANDQALYYDGSVLRVIPDSGPGLSSYNFRQNQIYTLDFVVDQKRFGVVFGDQGAGDFVFNFFRDGVLQASYTDNVSPTGNEDTLYYETDFLFDRVTIDAVGTDGFGIDNLTFAIVPEPSSSLLIASLLTGLIFGRRARRGRK